MSQCNHRIAFNCDLFMDIVADENATTADLERLVIKALREAARDYSASLTDIGVEFHKLDGARLYPRVANLDGCPDDDAQIELENFSIDDVKAVAA